MQRNIDNEKNLNYFPKVRHARLKAEEEKIKEYDQRDYELKCI